MTKSFKEMQGIKEACWVGYKQVGMKKKGDRMVPNCVKEEVVDAVFGKDYVYQENYQDMYKGKLNKNQIATIKNTWAGKKASDVTQGVRDMVKNMDQFTRMDLKKANIKHISALINDEYDFALPLSDLIEMQEFNAAVRHTELKEFTDEQISKLAKSYADLAGKTMSVQNANKLRKLFDRIPDRSLDALRRKKIPFLSGLALSRMVQKGMPVKEDKDEPELKPGKGAKIGPAGKIALAKEKDTDALEEQLTTAKLKADKLDNFEIPSLQEEETPVQQGEYDTRTQNVERDVRAEEWAKANPWFDTDDEMRGYAYGLHTKLLKQGVDPRSDEYYETIDSRMRTTFPDYFQEEPEVEKPKRQSNVVAPATRSTAPKKVKLTQTQVALANRLGVPLEEYAKQAALEARRQNG